MNSNHPTTKANDAEHEGGLKKPKLLVFDDIQESLGGFVYAYTQLGYEVIPVLVTERGRIDENSRLCRKDEIYNIEYGVSGEGSLNKLLEMLNPDLILSDNGFPSGFSDGPALVKAAQKFRPKVPCVVHSGTLPAQGKIDSKNGYGLVSKSDSVTLVDRYFKEQLAKRTQDQSPSV